MCIFGLRDRLVYMRSVAPLILLLAACVIHAQQADSARLASRPNLLQSTTRYAVAAGLPDLEIGPHIAGDREIRVWIGFGMTSPQSLFRLVEHDHVVTGEYIRYWYRRDPISTADSTSFAALMRYWERGRCGPVRKGPDAEACVARLISQPPWRRIWRTIDSLGVWTLPDESTLKGGNLTLDGWGIAVETWDGVAYHAWSYANPQSQPWPEAKLAERIARAFDTVGVLLKEPAGMRRLRGKLLTRADTLEFWGCDGSGPFMLEADARPLIAITGRGDSTQPYRLPHPYYVELLALAEPDFLVRKWWELSPYYVGVLAADSVKHMRPWAPELCRR
jgi:hypothetical protein